MGTPHTSPPVPNLGVAASARRLPIRILPQPDELFSSWLTRVALANGLRVNQLAGLLSGRHRQLFSGDIDRGTWTTPGRLLANLLNVEYSLVQGTYLKAYEGFLWGAVPEHGVWRHVLHLATAKRDKYYFGLQFCPRCLAEDESPYFRRSWRLAFSVVCDWHGCELFDRCPHCGAPIQPHRSDVGQPRYDRPKCITDCSLCHVSLLVAPRVLVRPEFVESQRLLLATVERGWISIAGRCVHSLPFFDGLHMLMSFMDDEERAAPLIHLLAPRNSHEPTAMNRRRYGGIERCQLRRRRAVTERVAQLLKNWPTDAMDLFQRAGLSSGSLGRYALVRATGVPFWLWQPVKAHVDRSAYVPTRAEVENAARYLLRTEDNPTLKQLCRLLSLKTRSSQRISALWREAGRRYFQEVDMRKSQCPGMSNVVR